MSDISDELAFYSDGFQSLIMRSFELSFPVFDAIHHRVEGVLHFCDIGLTFEGGADRCIAFLGLAH
ncbi:MAG: hypothetical protein AB9Q18_01310, partial [Candidatus Reddybacter sp.]